MPASAETRFAHPAQRAMVALVVALAVMLVAAPLLLWPTVHIATSRAATVRLGDAALEVTVADTPVRQRYGLQGRDGLDEDHGMLFVFETPAAARFSRKTVTFDLEVVFVDAERRVTRVAPLDGTHPIAEGPDDTLYAIEVREGWSDRHDVEPGTTLTLPVQE